MRRPAKAIHPVAGILALVWMCIIFSFSAQDRQESGAVSEGVSYELVSSTGFLFHLNLDEDQIREIAGSIERTVRKAAHMTEYAILAVLFYVWRWRRQLLAVAMAAAYAASDEFHQLFVEGRAGRVSDVLIDSAGALVGVGICTLCIWLHRRRRQRRKTE